MTSNWQTIPNNDSGASGLAYAGDGIFLLVNEAGFWEVGLEPLRAQRADFVIEGALELEAVCAVPDKAGQFMVLEKNSARVTLIVRDAPGVFRQLSQFVVPKQEGEILECLDCFTLNGQTFLVYGHRGGSVPGRLYWASLDDGILGARVASLEVTAPFEPMPELDTRHLSDFKVTPTGELWAVSNRKEPAGEFSFAYRTLVWRMGTFSANFQFQAAAEIVFDVLDDRKTEGLEFQDGRMILVADGEGTAEILVVPDPRPPVPMDLAEWKRKVKELEPQLAASSWCVLHSFERNGQVLELALTERLRKTAKKLGLWISKELLATLKNASYGFEPDLARSAGGRDGIFLLDRDFRPENEMMRKLFQRFLDKPEGQTLLAELKAPKAELLPVRLVSHHLRLLGILRRLPGDDLLVLVDCDR